MFDDCNIFSLLVQRRALLSVAFSQLSSYGLHNKVTTRAAAFRRLIRHTTASAQVFHGEMYPHIHMRMRAGANCTPNLAR